MTTRRLLLIASCTLLALTALPASAASSKRNVQMRLELRTQVRAFHDSTDEWKPATFEQTLSTAHTAIIITDMWDRHWCRGATMRVGQIAERMEPVLEQARAAGILIIHAPSETMSFYANTPGRLLAQNAPTAIPDEVELLGGPEPPLPIDMSTGGCDTGDKSYKAWTRENPTLKIEPGDVISDNGTEIYNVLKQHHITTILYMGVHANICILKRSFGIRKMASWGMHCILVRDLTDAMYNPKTPPFVSHEAGTEMVIEHIEKYWAPTVTSTQLLAALKSGD